VSGPEEVDRYLDELLASEPVPGFDTGGLPAHEVTPLQGKLLELLARATDAKAILELGTLGGYSTICLARGLAAGGRVTTLEIVPEYAEKARANVDRAGVGGVVDIHLGPAEHTLTALTGPFDLIFIDADKGSNPLYLTESLRLSRPGTMIVADNVVREGAVADPATEDRSAQGVRRFLEMLRDEPRLEATAIQTVGAKGWDGFVLALVSAASP
jgi:predicted O-methyltransferase YrrM